MHGPGMKRLGVAVLAAILIAVASVARLRHGIGAVPDDGMRWSAGRTGPSDPVVFGFQRLLFRSGAPSVPSRTNGWALVAGWFYLCRYEVAVERR